ARARRARRASRRRARLRRGTSFPATRRSWRNHMVSIRRLVGVVGDCNPRNATHVATNDGLAHAGLDFEWVPTDAVGNDVTARLGGYAGVFIAPASPYRSMDGALRAIRHARERAVPLVGT